MLLSTFGYLRLLVIHPVGAMTALPITRTNWFWIPPTSYPKKTIHSLLYNHAKFE